MVFLKKYNIKLVFFLALFLALFFQTKLVAENIETKCGTFNPNKEIIIKRLFENSNLKNDELLERKDNILPMKYSSPKNYFYIHYAIDGIDAVDTKDADNNGIPDYIDSVAYYYDYVYEFEVNKLGFNAPFPDGNKGGNSLYDIYVCELGKGYNAFYGLTYFELNSDINSYIVIDNNYSPNDSSYNSFGKLIQTYNTFGSDGLKVTAAHEFHHAIQFTYRTVSHNSAVIAEMSSTFMEYIVFPEIKDYKYYFDKFVNNLPKYSLLTSEPSEGYNWSILFVKLYEKYNDHSFLKKIWENSDKYFTNYQIINESIIETLNSNLDDELLDLVDWIYNTGEKGNNLPHFKDVEQMKSLKFSLIDYFTLPSIIHSNSMLPYSFYPVRIYFPLSAEKDRDTIDLFIINFDKSEISSSKLVKSNFSFSISEFIIDCNNSILNDNFCFKFDNSDYFSYKIFENYGNFINNVNDVFPNPFSGESNYLAFPVSKSYKKEKIHIAIYNIDNYCVYENYLEISIIESFRVAALYNIPQNLNNGIYFYKLSDGDNILQTGKFTIEKLFND